ncbi:unnamed protein product, partial [Heterobilharzia americana]
IVMRKHAARRLGESRHRRSGNTLGRKSPSGSSSAYSPTLSPVSQTQTNSFSIGNSSRSSDSTTNNQGGLSRETSRSFTNPDNFKQTDRLSCLRRTTGNNVNLTETLSNNSYKQ